ncbi:16S rRNA methyltransferase [Candidatus Saccharibacteria bacterium]|nr:MAG: 16S rRNA methyltransferase [Candidatus Saccharibacteria bacterium]
MRKRLHRFYVGEALQLKHDFWLHDDRFLWQWRKVLRMQAGQEVVLFDGQCEDRLYRILELKDNEAHLQLVTEMHRQVPARDVYLLWSLLKKDKNDWVLQKATELGAGHLIPLVAERSEKLGFDADRARRIVVEAAEQCGRSDIPSIREPITPEAALRELSSVAQIYVCEQGSEPVPNAAPDAAVALLVGPEGGWSDAERQLFVDAGLPHVDLGQFTLRGETAAVVATALAATL